MGGVKVELLWLAAFPTAARAEPERAKAAEASEESKRREFIARDNSQEDMAGRTSGWGGRAEQEDESSRGASEPVSIGYFCLILVG